jgi:hypothetical protein
MSKSAPTPVPASASPEPIEPDRTDLDTITEHALAALAVRFTKASATLQELFDDYTRQAHDILSTAPDTAETPDDADDNKPSTPS